MLDARSELVVCHAATTHHEHGNHHGRNEQPWRHGILAQESVDEGQKNELERTKTLLEVDGGG